MKRKADGDEDAAVGEGLPVVGLGFRFEGQGVRQRKGDERRVGDLAHQRRLRLEELQHLKRGWGFCIGLRFDGVERVEVLANLSHRLVEVGCGLGLLDRWRVVLFESSDDVFHDVLDDEKEAEHLKAGWDGDGRTRHGSLRLGFGFG